LIFKLKFTLASTQSHSTCAQVGQKDKGGGGEKFELLGTVQYVERLNLGMPAGYVGCVNDTLICFSS